VARGIRRVQGTSWIIGDLPFGSYQESREQALRSATAGQPASAALNGVRTASLAMPSGSGGPLAGDDPRHLHTISSTQGVNDQTRVGYSVQTEPSADGNSVDMDQQRANFVDNAIRYESTLRFINSHVKTMMSAIQGQ